MANAVPSPADGAGRKLDLPLASIATAQLMVVLDDTIANIGTANQIKLSGQPVKGPIFEFSPRLDRY
jgi:hypothetical protein